LLYLAFCVETFGGWKKTTRTQALEKWPHVVAIVPARNEAATIARVITSLLSQDYPATSKSSSLTITATMVRPHSPGKLRKSPTRSSNHSPLGIGAPEGWTGKLWALK